MRVLISGSSGFVGSALTEHLQAAGHRVIRLLRGPVRPGTDAIRWDIESREIDVEGLKGIDAVVHLAGEGIGDHRWSDGHKARVLRSRVEGTTLLSETIAALPAPPEVLLSGSAVGFYGDRGPEKLTENDGVGSGFLADVVAQWEASTEAAEAAGIRVAHLRSGIVLSPKGGALRPQLLPFRLGLGGKLGSGRQWVSWITLEDHVRAVEFLLGSALDGPVNLTTPRPVTNAEFTKALGRVLGRPTLLTVPPLALRLAFADMADEMLLAGQRVLPAKLDAAGFTFNDPEIESALRGML